MPDDAEGEVRLCWANLIAQLHAGGMDVTNLVRVTVFLKRYEDRDINAKVRFKILGDHCPALSTIITDLYIPPACWK